MEVLQTREQLNAPLLLYAHKVLSPAGCMLAREIIATHHLEASESAFMQQILLDPESTKTQNIYTFMSCLVKNWCDRSLFFSQ
jgi:hypothetical protein